jgi:hypothetical protein
LWDSCFHAVVWAELGRPERALAELRASFGAQAADGFVPHITSWLHPELDAEFWGRTGSSCLTQPPMYGHALAELHRRGIEPGPDLIAVAEAALAFLVDKRDPHGDGGLVIVHPWESGCDDSPRWDSWLAADRFATKGRLVHALQLDPVTRSPVGSAGFSVATPGFVALVAWNLRELAVVSVDRGPWCLDQADRLVAWLRTRWHEGSATFVDRVDVEPAGGNNSGGAVRTLDAVLALLVLDPGSDAGVIDAVARQLLDPTAFGGRCGPAAVHRGEPTFDPSAYWRGPAWPQLSYLHWCALRRLGRDGDAAQVGDALVRGAWRSGLAEYWHPDTGAGGGAAPQSWTALATVVAGSAQAD